MTPVLNRQTNTGKKKKTIWISLIAFVILCFVVCTVISLYVGISLTKLDKNSAVKNPGDYGMHYSNQVFLSKDGIT
ncbi:alpha/beta hydrolase, partial [Priestia megaterium]